MRYSYSFAAERRRSPLWDTAEEAQSRLAIAAVVSIWWLVVQACIQLPRLLPALFYEVRSSQNLATNL